VRRSGPTTARYARYGPVVVDAAPRTHARIAVLFVALAVCAFAVLSGTGTLAVAVGSAGDALGSVTGGVLGAAPSPTPAPVPPPPAPRLAAPPAPTSNTDETSVRGRLPAGVAGSPGVRIRIYVNDRRVKEQPAGKKRAFVVKSVPLNNGRNEIRASLVTRAGESERSNMIELLFDVTPPAVTITEPAQDAVVNASAVTIRGSTEPSSTVTVTNGATGKSATARTPVEGSAAAGRFVIRIGIAEGTNPLTVAVVDMGGNRSERELRVVKGDGKLKVQFGLSRTLIYRSRLPGTVVASVRLLNPDGRPIDGAQVTFSISPPGLPTSTYETSTSDGTASWSVALPKEGAIAGRGFATAMIVLPDGRTIRKTQRFTFG
jgi:hypothetical protein